MLNKSILVMAARMAFADKPNHFINFPLAQFSGFMDKYLKFQSQLVEMGLDCKLQKAPHVSITLLDISAEQYKQVEFAIQEILDDLEAYEGDIVFDNPHMLGRCLILDVKGFEELHEDIVEILRRRGCTADQSRQWIPHCTVAQFDEERETNGLQFYHNLPFYLKHNSLLTDARLELVKIGSSKIDGFYCSQLSIWCGERLCYKPPTPKFSDIFGYCCIEKIRVDLEIGDLPEDDEEAWAELSYHYQRNTYFFRYVYDNSIYFRTVCRMKGCMC